ncbi:MAG TPA: methionyl-tRNA formyltransferase [Acidobacteriaceae bacterium]|nr:methionyl-tRNA formyltransferase [Acidobacteriaceae bacterium]
MKLVFCGTPRFAAPTLKQLIQAGHSIELVVTQPDRLAGRGQELTMPAVKLVAMDKGLPVVQPEKIRNNPEFAERLQGIQPDAIIVVAYGRIIPKWMLELPRLGNLNLHASLLPKYRGAAPIQWAIANGEAITGTTTMRIDEGLDTGDILLQRELAIAPDQTAEDLFPLLAESGASLMVDTLEALRTNSIQPIPQDDSAASLAPILKREDAMIDFNRSANEIYNRWRGFQPWPGAFTFFRGRKLTLHRLMPMDRMAAFTPPGSILVERGRMFVVAGNGSALELFEVQLEGKKRLPAADFLHGAMLLPGERLGS